MCRMIDRGRLLMLNLQGKDGRLDRIGGRIRNPTRLLDLQFLDLGIDL